MRKLELKEFLKYRFLSGIELSPDGKNLGYVVHEANEEENNYRSNLWLYDTEGESSFQLTAFNKEGSYQWLPDSQHIIFSAVREEQDKKKLEQGEVLTQYYKINIHGGEARKYFSIPKRVTGLKALQSNQFLFTALYDLNEADISHLSKEEKAKELARRKEERDYEVLEEIPFWSNGKGYTSKKRTGLYLFDLKSNETKVIFQENDAAVEGYRINDSKTKLLFIVGSTQGKAELTNSLYLYDLEMNELKLILEAGKFSLRYADFLDDEHVAFFGSDMKQFGINENAQLFSLDLSTKGIVNMIPGLDISISSTVGSDCRFGASAVLKKEGEWLYLLVTEADSSYLRRIHLPSRHIEGMTVEKGSVDGFTLQNGQVYFIAMRDLKLQEIYQLTEQGEEKQITSLNQWLQNEVSLSKPEPLSFESEPGVWIHGWVMKPADYQESKKYPAILDIHGGPKTVYGEVLYHEMQYWANEGYFVFFCNPRGSDGRGNEFADIRGKYGTIDYDDLMRFTDQVMARYPEIDAERIGVTGGSYGGFMVNWMIGHTNRFKAAATQRSISNWISKFCTTDIGYYFVDDQQAATPWSDVEKLWWHSPLRYADQVKTPTLLIHSDEDYRCWITEAYQMFTALKYHGVEARMCIFRGENHELSRSGKPKHRVRRLEEITNWLNRYLKDQQ